MKIYSIHLIYRRERNIDVTYIKPWFIEHSPKKRLEVCKTILNLYENMSVKSQYGKAVQV